jgi:putative peptide zinc metalloprotease protein
VRNTDGSFSDMKQFSFTFRNHHFVLTNSGWDGQEELVVDGTLVSRSSNGSGTSLHTFALEGLGALELAFTIHPVRAEAEWLLRSGDRVLAQETVPVRNVATPPQAQADVVVAEAALAPGDPVPQPKKGGSHLVVLVGVAFKLVKSVKVFQVALAAASLSAYSILFSFEFALALLAILVFHEYGHLRAMQKFGIPTKGMYLIPFVGGIAVGDKPSSRWQDVYISLMGPVYGLFMTVVCYVAYLATGSHFVGLVASFSALINLFNLLPIYPLDGGRVIKSLVFSGRKTIALVFLLGLSAVSFAASVHLGFALIGFFVVIGVVDILSEWKTALAQDIAPLNRYGIWFCLAWYVATAAVFLVVMVLIARSGLPGSEIALAVLDS